MRAATLTEHFAGNPKKGGGRLSEVFELACGVAERRDLFIDESHDVTEDDPWWNEHLKKPSDVEAFAPPCTSFSIARVTGPLGKTRSKDNPWGNELDPEIKKGNAVARITIKRVLQAIAAKAAIIVENPMLSFFWWLPEVLALIGMPGMFLVRMDDCMFGEPYRKARLWLTNIENLSTNGTVCNHEGPHREALYGGSQTRQTATYPYGLVAELVETIAANFVDSPSGYLGTDNSQIAAGIMLDETVTGKEEVQAQYQNKCLDHVGKTRSGKVEYVEGCAKEEPTSTTGLLA